MALSFTEVQAVARLAKHLYGYLPGSSYGGRAYTFADAAAEARVGEYWSAGSKLPALTQLLELTLDHNRGRFCPLIEAIVRGGLKYRSAKGDPLTRADVEELNRLVMAVGFKIPGLWDAGFLAALPGEEPTAPEPAPVLEHASKETERAAELSRLLDWFLQLGAETDRQQAGRELEVLLRDLFSVFGLEPRGGFVVPGEQIDGSIVLDGASYLVEAKWEKGAIELAPLLAFREKVGGKSAMTYGIFISVNGFTEGARESLTRGRQPNFFMVDGRHLYAALAGEVDLVWLLRALRRELADKGRPLVPLPELTVP